MKQYNPLELARKYKVYKGPKTTIPDTYTMLRHLRNISSKAG